MIKLEPLGDRVIVRPHPLEEKKGNLIFVDAKQKPQTGIVIGAGDLIAEKKLKIGVEVMFGKHSGTPIQLNGESVLMMRESELFSIISEVVEGAPAEPIIPPTKL